jgi:hypothetical protein
MVEVRRAVSQPPMRKEKREKRKERGRSAYGGIGRHDGLKYHFYIGSTPVKRSGVAGTR